MSNLAPYRSAPVKPIDLSVPQFGLIRYTPPPPAIPSKHYCKLPKKEISTPEFFRIFGFTIRLGGTVITLKDNDLWRCNECGEVYKYRYWQSGYGIYDEEELDCVHSSCDTIDICLYWIKSNIQEWIEAGGRE